MKLLAIYILFNAAIASGHEYQITLSYYSKPIKQREWSISIFRDKDSIIIDIDNFRGKRLKKSIPRDSYIALIDRLNKSGIWILKDSYIDNSPNGYYLVEVIADSYKNIFRVENGPPLRPGYLDIIRSIKNTAMLYIYDM